MYIHCTCIIIPVPFSRCWHPEIRPPSCPGGPEARPTWRVSLELLEGPPNHAFLPPEKGVVSRLEEEGLQNSVVELLQHAGLNVNGVLNDALNNKSLVTTAVATKKD